jgi:hypothetical protein
MDKGFKIFMACWIVADIAIVLAIGIYNGFL